ncbi:NlpC/P60 family protein [Streptomyces sp. TRM 70351]|uniref:C40 family peptidase n=1 Tax=Streptomyces sp. TRM 70351 TaxID=3116552 RepID=UPI002E7B0682|nr:NlpC/P60 family protein [Streptomyces sp. TRM 70351]MEE1928694.1 NlpC/P60 family protein [Streptomyces sp. TRM 70351]
MGSHRSHRHSLPGGFVRGARVTVLTAAASAAALTAVPAGADPGGASAASVSARVDELYLQAERATGAYNDAAEKVTALRRQVQRAQDEVARGQERVNRLRAGLGSVAGAQYRAAGLDPAVALLLSTEPDAYLDKAATLERISTRNAGELRALRGAQRLLDARRGEATRKLGALEEQRGELRRHKKSVQSKLAAARRLLNRLTAEEREERERRERASRYGSRAAAAPPPAGPAASGRSGAALSAAQRVLGRPYAWGQAGPHAFDCAGLTQWAYRQAGVSLPRTSQAQARAGSRVPLAQARPGDLVIYRGDASHVAMYAGNGQVIHSPYPGAQVRYDPVGMMPVTAVTRP